MYFRPNDLAIARWFRAPVGGEGINDPKAPTANGCRSVSDRHFRACVVDLDPQRVVIPRVHPAAIVGMPDHIGHEFARNDIDVFAEGAGVDNRRKRTACASRCRPVVIEGVDDVRCYSIDVIGLHIGDIPSGAVRQTI